MAQLNIDEREELKVDISVVLNQTDAYNQIRDILSEKFGKDFDFEEVVRDWEENLIEAIQYQLDEMEELKEADE